MRGVTSIIRKPSTSDDKLYSHLVADAEGKVATGHLDNVHDSLERDDLFALAVQHRREERRGEMHNSMRCLLLEAEQGRAGFYRRVGAMTIHGKDRLAFFEDIEPCKVCIV